MGADVVLFFIFLLSIAAILRGDFVFTLLYLLAGVLLLGRAWSQALMQRLRVTRRMVTHAFLGEQVTVRLGIANPSLLPAVWLHVQEHLTIELGWRTPFERVISLNPFGRTELEYRLRAYKRGVYAVGPATVISGDLLGLTRDERRETQSACLVVYPQIVPLTRLSLPSRSPLGTLRHTQPVFEDPSRVLSKRDYVAGDSLRRVDWKASAAAGRPLVKQYEPSIALETMLLLNLNAAEYPTQQRVDSTELGIVLAASLANWIVGQRQAVGLVTNGRDPSAAGAAPAALPSRKGRPHLIHVLETLARLQPAEGLGFAELIRQQAKRLPWGTTLILITGSTDEPLFDAIFQCQRRGQQVVLILAGLGANLTESQRRAAAFGIPVHGFRRVDDLDVWRR